MAVCIWCVVKGRTWVGMRAYAPPVCAHMRRTVARQPSKLFTKWKTRTCIQAPGHFWSSLFSQKLPYYKLHICAQMLVYKHQRIFEACLSPKHVLTMNFTYVAKCLHTSTNAFLKLAFLPTMSLLWKSHMCPNACIHVPAHFSMLLLNRPHLPGQKSKYVPKCSYTSTRAFCDIRMFICFVL